MQSVLLAFLRCPLSRCWRTVSCLLGVQDGQHHVAPFNAAHALRDLAAAGMHDYVSIEEGGPLRVAQLLVLTSMSPTSKCTLTIQSFAKPCQSSLRWARCLIVSPQSLGTAMRIRILAFGNQTTMTLRSGVGPSSSYR